MLWSYARVNLEETQWCVCYCAVVYIFITLHVRLCVLHLYESAIYNY